MSITSVNLSALPFMGSCDSTRAQMASKQMSQALTHPNCEIPYVISNEYRNLVNSSFLGICIAKDDGEVIFNASEILIIYYTNLKKLQVFQVSIIKKTSSMFASSLRFILPQDSKFKKNDIIFEYDGFKNGIPSFGYNVMTAYMAGFGFNHEDSLIISESFAEKAKVKISEKVYIPIYEHTVLMPIYKNIDNSLIYFPNIGQKIKGTTVCSTVSPNATNYAESNKTIKNKMMLFFKNATITDLLNLNNQNTKNIKVEEVKTKIENGTITGLNIHRLQKGVNLIDPRFQDCLNKLVINYCEQNIFSTFNDLQCKFNQEYAKQIIKQNIMYSADQKSSNKSMMKNAIYLIELEITREDSSQIGDKFCNR
ncbi:hypothetical protein K9L16_04220 [Candidatus Pacearchaeota archaeon]|nr:hypothetical protein [Candidatus Pacearchaeota archaeon]